jgi:hypothetical protein
MRRNRTKQELILGLIGSGLPCCCPKPLAIPSRYSEPLATAAATTTAAVSPPTLPCFPIAPTTDKSKTPSEEITELRAIIDNMAASLATVQGNKGQLTVVVNRIQLEKVVLPGERDGLSHRDLIANVARHGHKLLFPTYDGADDPLSWLNRCEQFPVVLVHWQGRSVAEATWEPLDQFKEDYPYVKLEDELFCRGGGGGSVVDSSFGRHYVRKNKKGRN